MTAALAVIPSSRRISAGIAPDPGATSRLPAWWGRADWIADVSITAAAHGDLLRAHHVSLDAVMSTARSMAAWADHRTGRDCRPTNARLTVATRYSLSVVQRARRVLKELGYVVELLRGRNIMTRAERLEAWRRGSAARCVASTFALCSRSPKLHLLGSRRAPKVSSPKVGGVDNSLGASAPVEDDHLPGAKGVSYSSHLRSTHLRRRTEIEEGRSAPPSPARTGDGQARRLAEQVRDRLGWLRGTSWRRLAPTLGRFARAGWTVADVEIAVRDELAARGWTVPRELTHPAAYLAGLLRGADESDRPSVTEAAYEAHLAAQAAAERAGRRAHLLEIAGKCAHGVPGSGAGQPSRGVLACLECHR